MSEAEILLAGLHDVIEPAAPANSSLWFMAGNFLLFLLIMLCLFMFRHRRRNRWRRQALQIISQAQSQRPDTTLLTLAGLLRRIMSLRNFDINRLEGRAWLRSLDDEFNTRWFTEEEGQLFGDSLYQPIHVSDKQRDRICHTLASLIRSMPVAVQHQHLAQRTAPAAERSSGSTIGSLPGSGA